MTAMAAAAPRLLRTIVQRRTALAIASIVILAALGFEALHRIMLEVRLHDLRAAFHEIAGWRLGACLALTSLSYLLLTYYDVLALRVIGRPLPWRTAALASFTSYTLSHNLGLSLLTGGSARYRIYSAKGLPPGDIARVIAIASLTFWTGVVVIGASALLVSPGLSFGTFSVPHSIARACGAAVLVGIAVVFALVRRLRSSPRVLGWELPLPSIPQGLAQIGLAALDLAAASTALLVLAPHGSLAVLPMFFLAYVLAIAAGAASHVPGGVGVFEAVMLASLPDFDKASLFAALIAYRAIYYLLPLLLAAVLVAIHEHRTWRGPLAAAVDTSHAVVSGIAPMLLSGLALVGGAVLLVSGALPAVPHRLQALSVLLPLPFVEASHIAASLSGTGLLVLAPGLYKRLDGAFILARLFLLAGAVFSLFKGFDYEEATILLIIAGILQWSRPAFYRHTTLTVKSFSGAWIAAAGVAAGLALWIGFFAFKHVDYQSELWWQFAWKGNASRFLRASFAMAVLLIGTIVYRFFGPAEPAPLESDRLLPQSLEALDHATRADAMLALTGDKRFLLSPSGAGFLMYQVQGRSWIVMGDPVGPRGEWADLFWSIRERADACQGRLLLYQLSAEALPYAIDLGLRLIKYGEEARVDLARFTMEGSDARSLRHACRRARREGATFAIVPAAEVPTILPELRSVSDEWLADKRQTEKGFSIGAFSAEYVSRFDCAVVRVDDRIVAFANVWKTADHEEISVDLMRHRRTMPYGAMDFLFVRLIQMAQAQGYRSFNLGLAPLSGIEARRLAPAWAHAGSLLYRHGEALYGFEGLRAYKDKFSPVWEPRYIAGPNGLALARAVIDLQALIGGGAKRTARPNYFAAAA